MWKKSINSLFSCRVKCLTKHVVIRIELYRYYCIIYRLGTENNVAAAAAVWCARGPIRLHHAPRRRTDVDGQQCYKPTKIVAIAASSLRERLIFF